MSGILNCTNRKEIPFASTPEKDKPIQAEKGVKYLCNLCHEELEIFRINNLIAMDIPMKNWRCQPCVFGYKKSYK